jgi:hypothetical protein
VITRLEIDGSTTFVGFEPDVHPCTVPMGLNGAGKPNLLDAPDRVRRWPADTDEALKRKKYL